VPFAVKQIATACRICGARCGLIVLVEGNRIIDVRGDKEHPISRGFTCIKGRSLGELHHHPNRLNYPLVRRNDDFVRVSWEEALAEIAGTLRRILDESGPDAIGIYWASGGNSTLGYVGPRGFLSAIGSGTFFSASSIDLPSKYVVEYEMTRLPRYVVPLADLAHTDCLLLLGTNPAVSMGHDYAAPMGLGAIREIRKRGGTVVAVDPRETESARLADLHVRVRPGSDPFLLQAMLRVIVDEGLADASYVRRHCSGLEALVECVRSRPVEPLAELCGVPAAAITDIARRFGTAKSAVAIAGTGLTFGPFANVAIWLQWCLNAITGNLDSRGGMFFNRGVLNPITPKPSARSLYSGRQSRVRDVRSLNDEMPSSALADEILTEGPGRIRALLVHGGNPLMVVPNQRRAIEAFQRLDLLVSMDIFLNQTANYAHFILPGVDQLEREDLSIIGEQIYPLPFAQVYQQAVESKHERRNEYETYRALLRLMGIGDDSLKPEKETIEHMCRRSEIPLEELRQLPHGKVMGEPPYGWLLAGLQTPDGKLDLAPELLTNEFRRMWREQPARDTEAPAEDERFPLRLANRRMLQVFNSWLSNLPSIAPRAPVNPLLVHPNDAALYGLSDGGRAVVESAAGQVTASVQVTTEIGPGVVSLPHGWGSPEADSDGDDWRGGNVNLLTDDRDGIDPVTGMPRYTGIPVSVRPVYT
jgi:anaerobic selenocysteine-containing dehydrogenase